MTKSAHTAKTIAVVSYVFPHYRKSAFEALSKFGHEAVYLGPREDPHAAGVEIRIPEDGGACIVTKATRFGKTPLLWMHGTIGYALRGRYDAMVLYSGVFVLSSWIVICIARLRRKPLFLWAHGWRSRRKGLKNRVTKLYFRLFDGIFLFSDHARTIGIEEGFAAERLHVVYNSLDTDLQNRLFEETSAEDISTLKAALFANPELPVVTCMSRLTARRELQVLIDAAGVLARKGRPINLLVVGEGPERSGLEALCVRHDLGHAFTGACYDERQIARYFRLSDVTVSPGPIGLLVMHSFVYGVPVISNDDPSEQGPEWYAIEEGVNGGHFARGDPHALAMVIERWLSDDRDLTREKCREVVLQRYNPHYQREVFARAIGAHL